MWLTGCRPSRFHELFILASRFSLVLGLITYSHALREGNYMADALAKQGVNQVCELVAWLRHFI
jgi:hypothetical protein